MKSNAVYIIHEKMQTLDDLYTYIINGIENIYENEFATIQKVTSDKEFDDKFKVFELIFNKLQDAIDEYYKILIKHGGNPNCCCLTNHLEKGANCHKDYYMKMLDEIDIYNQWRITK